MGKLQYITWVIAISILGLSTIKITNAAASVFSSKSQLMALKQSKKITAESSPENEMSISATATVSHYELAQKPKAASTDKKSPHIEDEMIDALQKRQEKIENLKELKTLQEIVKKKNLDDKILNTLQKRNLNIESLEELKELQEIVNNENLDSYEMLDALKERQINIESIEELQKIQEIVNKENSNTSKSVKFSKSFAFKMFTIGLPVTILVIVVATPFVKGIFGVFTSNFQQKFGKPQVPEGSVMLHNQSFKEITIIGNKAEKINDDKFGNEEFKLLIQIKINIAKGIEDYKKLNYCVELLKAAIITQKSFLMLEATELSYRSRKQQEFYHYVADNLEENIDKEAFAKKVKNKQAKILPLITTEEGRSAIESYVKEINIISQYDLGLKLLALFKKYELKDFSILKKVSNVVESLKGKDLLSAKNLISLVIENYNTLEKLNPILSISEAESSPVTYARILQVIGLENRHGKAYYQFEQLVKELKKWEKPYKSISMVRKEYTSNKYQIPREFKENIPGISIYNKYSEYLVELGSRADS